MLYAMLHCRRGKVSWPNICNSNLSGGVSGFLDITAPKLDGIKWYRQTLHQEEDIL